MLHLCQLIDRCAEELMVTGTVTVLWGEAQQASQELAEWLTSDAVFQALSEFREGSLEHFPFVFSQLEGMRSARKSQE